MRPAPSSLGSGAPCARAAGHGEPGEGYASMPKVRLKPQDVVLRA